jgi:U3 small nucleolar RNA-associated protein 5
MNPGSELLCSVSANGDCVALCSSDGIIKFFDTQTCTLKLEYSSSTHLQASCTCLSWSRHNKNNLTSTVGQKKKKIKSIENELIDLDLIAIGTSEGSILLYSLSKAELHSQLVLLFKSILTLDAQHPI